MANYRNGFVRNGRSFTPDHIHSVGFAHEPRKTPSISRSAVHKPKYSEQHEQYLKDTWEELVNSTPREDAGVAEGALSDFHWKGRDLHSQRRYLALRLRFRREPWGYIIAHDIHDAVKESRKSARKQEKEANRLIKRAKKTAEKSTPESLRTLTAQSSLPTSSFFRLQDSAPNRGRTGALKGRKEQPVHLNNNRELDTHHLIGEDQTRDIETSTARVKKKLAKIFAIRPGTASSKATAATPWATEEDPFRDPSPIPKRVKTKVKKLKKKKKATASLESLNSAQDPFRDPSPMRVIDADDFRL
ncbi:hypothetical protein F4803DRAFT_552010 [Xylaria telfairii]|nr:hypothetical protein F4803DRAFT_552010 [Xylaria telfairii]